MKPWRTKVARSRLFSVLRTGMNRRAHELFPNVPDAPPLRPAFAVGFPLSTRRLLGRGVGRRGGPPAVSSQAAAGLPGSLLPGVPVILLAAQPRLSRRMVFTALFLSGADHRPGSPGRLAGADGLRLLRPQTQFTGVAAYDRLVVSESPGRGGGGQG